jgi:hypothetical protein
VIPILPTSRAPPKNPTCKQTNPKRVNATLKVNLLCFKNLGEKGLLELLAYYGSVWNAYVEASRTCCSHRDPPPLFIDRQLQVLQVEAYAFVGFSVALIGICWMLLVLDGVFATVWFALCYVENH